jgi:hypothetical protein
MIGRVLGVAGAAGLVALAGAAAAFASAAAAPASATAPAAAAGWHVVKKVHSGPSGDFTAVVATGKTTGWAFNGNPIASPVAGPAAWQRSGNTWTRAAFPGKSNEEVVAAGATSPSNVWAFTDVGTGSRVLHWNGRGWRVVKTFAKPIGGASMVSGNDVWVFGQPGIIEQLGAWHYNGLTWSRAAANLDGGSALSATSVWAFHGTVVNHWNGRAWSSVNVARLLPAKQQLNNPMVTGIYAQSATSVYAVGNGDAQDEGGPTVLLHFDGHAWRRVAAGSFGYGTDPSQQIAPDGQGGLWLPMPGYSGQQSYLVHYSVGRLRAVALPGGPRAIDVESVAHVPGGTEMLGGGFTHASGNPSLGVTAVILQYGG